MSLNLKKINEIKITPLINQKFNKNTVIGYEYFSNPFGNIALIARTKSGKTNTIYRVLEETLKPKSNVIIFCPSVNTDQTYIKMKSMLKKKECNIRCYESFADKTCNHLTDLVNELSKKEEKKDQNGKGRDIPNPLTMEQIMFTNDPLIVGIDEIWNGSTNGGRTIEIKKKPKKQQQ